MNSYKNLKIGFSRYSPPSDALIDLVRALKKEGCSLVFFDTQTSTFANKPFHFISKISRFVVRLLILRLIMPSRFKILKGYLGYGPFNDKNSIRIWQRITPVLIKLPDIFHVVNPDEVDDWIFLRKIYDVKLVLSLSQSETSFVPEWYPKMIDSHYEKFSYFDAFVVEAKTDVDTLLKYGIDINNIYIIRPGIQTRSVKASQSTSKTYSLVTAICFNPNHGMHYLLDALSSLEKQNFEFTLTILSEDVISEEILYQINDLNLQDRCRLHSPRSRRGFQESISGHDALIMPSVVGGVSKLVLEAMQMGLPILAANTGGMRGLIQENVNGLLFSNRSSKSIADALELLFSLTGVQRNLLVEQAQRTIAEKFDFTQSVKRHKKMYYKLLQCD